jgi:hypothetical protein
MQNKLNSPTSHLNSQAPPQITRRKYIVFYFSSKVSELRYYLRLWIYNPQYVNSFGISNKGAYNHSLSYVSMDKRVVAR